MAGSVGLRFGAEGSEVGFLVWQTDHCQRSGLMFTVERSRLGLGKTARGGIVWIVEPEADMESVGGRQQGALVYAEDLVEQDGLDLDLGFSLAVCLNVRLVPCHTHIRNG